MSFRSARRYPTLTGTASSISSGGCQRGAPASLDTAIGQLCLYKLSQYLSREGIVNSLAKDLRQWHRGTRKLIGVGGGYQPLARWPACILPLVAAKVLPIIVFGYEDRDPCFIHVSHELIDTDRRDRWHIGKDQRCG